MSTKIRLARGGSKKRPFYRIVVADSRRARDGKFIEKLGTYNPLLETDRVTIDAERTTEWLKKGAIPSERVLIFLNDAKIGQDVKKVKELNERRDNIIKLKAAEIAERKKKEAEEKAAKEAEEKAAAEAAAKEAEEAAAAEAAEAEASEAPAEEAPAEEAPAEEPKAEAEEASAEEPKAEEATAEEAPAEEEKAE